MYYIKLLLVILLLISIMGYIYAVLREKYYLKNNIIIVENKNVTTEDFKDIDMNIFLCKGLRLKTGDEIKIKTTDETLKGTLLGGNFKEDILKIITKANRVEKVRVENILDLKLIKEYGKFFTT